MEINMQRPTLNRYISTADFNAYYWLKKELIAFCRAEGLSASGGKLEIAGRIHEYLRTGSSGVKASSPRKQRSSFDWGRKTLTKDTVITDSYRNGSHVRDFFRREIGKHFAFNVMFMAWMRENTGKTLGDAILAWKNIDAIRKEKSRVHEIAPQFEYNRYVRAFLRDNPGRSRKDATRLWALKKMMPGSREYHPSDLRLT